MAGGNDRSPRGPARTWLVLVSLLVLLCTATVMVVAFGTSGDATDEPGIGSAGASNDDAPAAAAARASADPVRAASTGRRRRSEDPPGGRPRGEASGVVVAADPAAPPDANDPAAQPSDPAQAASGQTTTSSPGASKSGRVARGALRDDVMCDVVVEVTAAETEKPLRGVDVRITPAGSPELRSRTESDGTARLALPSYVSFDVDVKAPGRLRVKRSGTVPSRGTVRVVVKLERGVIVHGHVFDHERRVRGAAVRAVSFDALRASIPYGPEPATIEEATSARDGSYVLDCIPRGLACVLTSEAEGHASQKIVIEPQPDPDYDVRQDVFLPPGAVVEGLVITADSKPAPGTWVYAVDGLAFGFAASGDLRRRPQDDLDLDVLRTLRSLRLGPGSSPYYLMRRVLTGGDGTYRLTAPAGSRDAVMIAMHPTGGRSAPAVVEPGRGARRSFALRGRVPTAEFNLVTAKGRPAEGMSVAPHLPWETWTAPALAPGRYGYADMEDGPIAIDVSGPAGAPGTYVGRRVDADHIVWRALLRDGVTWKGAVADDRSEPVVGASVSAGVRDAVTDVEGHFEIVGVHPDSHQLVARAEGHLVSDTYVPDSHRERIIVTLPRAATLRMKLVLPRGAPAPTWYRVMNGVASGAADAKEDRLSWDDGVVEIRGWSEKDPELFVFVPGYEAVIRPTKAHADETLEVGAIELVPQAALGGKVVDEYGRTVARARVALRIAGEERWASLVPSRSVETDAEGRFEIGVAVPGRRLELTATADDAMETPQVVPPGAAGPVTLVLGRERDFFGRWTAAERRPARAVLLGPDDVEYATVAVTDDGTFRAVVPRPPRSVRIVSVDTSRAEVLRSVPVPPELLEGAVFDFP